MRVREKVRDQNYQGVSIVAFFGALSTLIGHLTGWPLEVQAAVQTMMTCGALWVAMIVRRIAGCGNAEGSVEGDLYMSRQLDRYNRRRPSGADNYDGYRGHGHGYEHGHDHGHEPREEGDVGAFRGL